MKTYQAYQLSASLRKELCLRPTREVDTSAASVSDICRDVKRRGDTALREYGRRFDAASVTALRVEPREVQAASREMSEDFRQALLVAASNIRTFHAAQGQSEPVIETMPGVVCRRERRPNKSGCMSRLGRRPCRQRCSCLGFRQRSRGVHESSFVLLQRPKGV